MQTYRATLRTPPTGSAIAVAARRTISFGGAARMRLYAQLASFTEEGLTPYRTLQRANEIAKRRLAVRPGMDGVIDSLRNRLSAKRRALAARTKVLDAVLASMDSGKSLGDAMARWIPAEESELLRTGERSDRLLPTLRELENLLKVKSDIASILLKAAAGAGFRFAVLVAMMFYILSTVLKEGKSMLTEDMFQKLTLAPIYFRFGELFTSYALPGLLAAIVGGAVIIINLPRWRPYGLRSWLDLNIAPWSVYSTVQAATLLLSASAMMDSGRQLREALESISRHGTPWLRTHCHRMLRRLKQGRTDAEALKSGILGWELEDQLGVYDLLNDFKQVMRAIARDSLQNVLRNVTVVGNLLNAVAMLALGGFILATIFAMGEIAMEAQSAVGTSPTP